MIELSVATHSPAVAEETDASVAGAVIGEIGGKPLPGEPRYPTYVFDPNNSATPEQIADDMEYVLENTSDRFREHLQRNMGEYATPNGGISPWEPELDPSVRETGLSLQNGGIGLHSL